uniref:NADH-ubiquinone oxidoreductase chain 6 n=1 Tax=Propithecus edwardsi TaxID=543559 RepID=A0A0A7DEV0_9PRIM|nr:NADH dehydrogenase subunit 6 [Propithecus edwardsi]UTE81640.1 NADH dehydrogenase subunit 6 [Propithecus edwardsi]UTE81653.1 NADH dehydrogenase subunit 6 [Propithecus edwardsi]UTE81666.1 NADH dehydrogenase subunit 6 [Propithecus edwardsi]
MAYVVFMLSVGFVLGFMSFSSKPSPIYGGVGLIVSGAVGCGMVMNFGGSFVGLMVFLIYLGGMLVVFGYTTAMATEEYPETWGSSVVIWGALLLGSVMELLVMMLMVGCEGLGGVGFISLENWITFMDKEVGVVREDSLGVTALYGETSWFVMIAAWSLFVSVLIVIEIIRG